MELWHAAWAALAGACVVARLGSRNYGDGGKGLAPLSLCEIRLWSREFRSTGGFYCPAIFLTMPMITKRSTRASPSPLACRRQLTELQIVAD
jgi:hypothetical protein